MSDVWESTSKAAAEANRLYPVDIVVDENDGSEYDVNLVSRLGFVMGAAWQARLSVTITDDMIERGARVLARRYGQSWDFLGSRIQTDLIDQARAALEEALGGDAQ